jgi:putative membrane protein
MAMGAADVVPGVSGGTIAFITGIYDEFLDALKNCTPAALLVWKKNGFMAMWDHINGSFLLALFGGILVSLKTFAGLITYALKAHPVLVWSFFFGLILASVVLLIKHIKRWRWQECSALCFGAAVVVVISLASPTQLPGYWWILFLGGFVAICAMILPGISGSFLLLLVGLYPVFLNAINNLEWILLLSFGAGAICGLMSFSRVLSWLLHHYHQLTVATLIGFLIGSLNVTWPWKEPIDTIINQHGETLVIQSVNVLPGQFALVTGSSPETVLAVLCAILGVGLVLATEFLATRLGKA